MVTSMPSAKTHPMNPECAGRLYDASEYNPSRQHVSGSAGLRASHQARLGSLPARRWVTRMRPGLRGCGELAVTAWFPFFANITNNNLLSRSKSALSQIADAGTNPFRGGI